MYFEKLYKLTDNDREIAAKCGLECLELIKETSLHISEDSDEMKKLLEQAKKDAISDTSFEMKHMQLDHMDNLRKLETEIVYLKREIELEAKYKPVVDLVYAQIDRLTNERNELKEKLDEISKCKTTKQLGVEGEMEMEVLLNEYVNGEIINVTKKAHSADFRVKMENTYIVDSKNYSQQVPKKERKQIISDVERDANVSGGILVSLRSEFIGKNHGEIEFIEDNKPVMYLSFMNMSNEERGRTLKGAFSMLEAITKIIKADKNEKNKEELLRVIKKNIEEWVHDVNNITNLYKQMGNSLISLRGKIINGYEWLSQSILLEYSNTDDDTGTINIEDGIKTTNEMVLLPGFKQKKNKIASAENRCKGLSYGGKERCPFTKREGNDYCKRHLNTSNDG